MPSITMREFPTWRHPYGVPSDYPGLLPRKRRAALSLPPALGRISDSVYSRILSSHIGTGLFSGGRSPANRAVLLYGLKTLDGNESINTLPNSLFSDETLTQPLGCNARQMRQRKGVYTAAETFQRSRSMR